MRQTNFALALLVAAVLAACGGSKGGDQTLKAQYSGQVTFGDSLSDVGTYAVGGVAALGGGKFTINGNSVAVKPEFTGKTWTELLAAQFGLAAPCAAQTGLDGNAAQNFSVPVMNHAGCFGYAQGGARVTHPVGPNNKLTGSPLGHLTVPVSTQIASHLAKVNGAFKGTEIVFVLAGGNDALMQLGQLAAGATAAGTAAGNAAAANTFATRLISLLAAGATSPSAAAQAIGIAFQTEAARPGSTQASMVGAAIGAAAVQPGNAAVGAPAVHGPMIATATADATAAGNTAGAAAGAQYAATNGPLAVAAMATAGAELGALVKTQIVAKGATRVVVNALPDLSISPSALAQPAATQGLIKAMIEAFNNQLKTAIAAEAKVLYVDLYTVSRDQAANPGPYGLSNTTTPACGANALGASSLVCNVNNLGAGDVSHYMFADDVHPTPFEHLLIARYVAAQMTIKGWL
ncbi:MAG: SGNH/GDSL hydrolase family protein [Pseudomonadota bacterium]